MSEARNEFAAIQARWTVLLELSAWILSLVGGFLLIPSFQNSEQAGSLSHFGKLMVAALSGLIVVGIALVGKRRYKRMWWSLGVVLLAAAVWANFRYQDAIDRYTVMYDGDRVIAGTEDQYPTDARRYRDSLLRAGRPVTREDMVMESVGPERVWTEDVLRENGRTIMNAYLLALAIVSALVVVVAHVVRGALPQRRGKA